MSQKELIVSGIGFFYWLLFRVYMRAYVRVCVRACGDMERGLGPPFAAWLSVASLCCLLLDMYVPVGGQGSTLDALLQKPPILFYEAGPQLAKNLPRRLGKLAREPRDPPG